MLLGFDAKGRKLFFNEENRSTHMHIIGSTQTGKSKFIEWLIRQDIDSRNGLCLIDPHGSLYQAVLEYCCYNRRFIKKDIILLNPSAGDHVVGFNPFRQTASEISVQVDQMIASTIRAWDMHDTDETPRLEKWLRCIYHTLIEKKLTLAATEYLIDYLASDVRESLTSEISTPIIKSELQKLNKMRAREFDDEIGSTKNKLLRFLLSGQIYRFMGLPKFNIDLLDIMESGKILLVNLAESERFSDPNARLFGSLLINELCQQAKKRVPDKSRPFYLYIDEFQNFVGMDIAKGLDQLRKFGLHFILAHQRFGQLGGKDADIVDAVMTNARTRAVFGGLRREDAIMLVEEMFVGQLDLKQVKMAIYQTKFWPVYGRDTVYGKSSGYSSGSSTMTSSSMGSSAAYASDGENWFDASLSSEPFSHSESGNTTDAEGQSDSYSYSESEIDIPIFYPVPFKELSSVQFYSLDELKWQMSDALKGQLLRHCFIQIPGRETQPMLVPFVKDTYVKPQRLEEYQFKLFQKSNAITPAQADELIESERKRLEQEAKLSLAESVEPETFRQPVKTVAQKKSK